MLLLKNLSVFKSYGREFHNETDRLKNPFWYANVLALGGIRSTPLSFRGRCLSLFDILWDGSTSTCPVSIPLSNLTSAWLLKFAMEGTPQRVRLAVALGLKLPFPKIILVALFWIRSSFIIFCCVEGCHAGIPYVKTGLIRVRQAVLTVRWLLLPTLLFTKPSKEAALLRT